MTLLIFAHIDTGHHILIIEKKLRQSLGKLCLSHTCGSHEQEGAYRPLFILQACTRAAHGICNRLYGHILTYYPFVKFRFHTKQFLPFALQHPPDRNACPFCNDFSYILRCHCLSDDRILYFSLTGSKLVYLLLSFRHLTVTYLGNLSVISSPFCIVSLYPVVLHLLTLDLKVRKYTPFLIPSAAKPCTFFIKRLEFFLDLIHLKRYTLTPDGLTLDFQLTDTTVELCDRFRNRVHLQTQLRRSLVH